MRVFTNFFDNQRTISLRNRASLALLIGIVLLESLGCYILPGLYQMGIKYHSRQTIEAGIPLHKICQIKIPVSGISDSFSLDGENECWYNGRLYDIISRKETKEYKLYFCVFDEKETAFICWFSSVLKETFSPLQQKNPALVFIQHIKTLYCQTISRVVFSSVMTRRPGPVRRIIKNLFILFPSTPPPEPGSISL